MKLPFKRAASEADDQATVRKRIESAPDGMFEKCAGCRELVYVKEFERNWKVCPRCQYHHPLRAHERVALLLDEDSFEETDAGLRFKHTHGRKPGRQQPRLSVFSQRERFGGSVPDDVGESLAERLVGFYRELATRPRASAPAG